MPNRAAYRAIEEEIGKAEIKRLTAYAYGTAYGLDWRRGAKALPGGGTPEDIVMEAIEKTIEGQHTWNQEKHPDIYDHLKDAIANILTNRVRLKEHATSADRVEPVELDRQKAPTGQGEQKWREHNCIEKVREAVQEEGDSEMVEVLDGILDDDLKRSDIAAIVGIEPKDYDNARKRILRFAAKVLTEDPLCTGR